MQRLANMESLDGRRNLPKLRSSGGDPTAQLLQASRPLEYRKPIGANNLVLARLEPRLRLEVAMRRSMKNVMASTLPCVLAFIILCIQPISAAQELSDEQLKLAREIYEKSEEEVRQRVEANVESLAREGEERNKRPLSSEELQAVRYLSIDAEYQKLVEMLTCVEKVAAISGENDLTERCYRDRLFYAEEMFRSSMDYPTLAKCKAKTRLIEIEMRYPPYAFMLDDRKEGPQAVDAKAFLECAKSRP